MNGCSDKIAVMLAAAVLGAGCCQSTADDGGTHEEDGPADEDPADVRAVRRRLRRAQGSDRTGRRPK